MRSSSPSLARGRRPARTRSFLPPRRDAWKPATSNPEYYRKLWRKAHTFRVDLPRKKWCDYWHDHFDWDGVGNQSKLDRRRHLKALFHAFGRAQRELAAQPAPYQVFVNISRDDSMSDALYVHTPNPNAQNFPTDFAQRIFLSRVPPLLTGCVDLTRYRIAYQTDGKNTWYTVIPKA